MGSLVSGITNAVSGAVSGITSGITSFVDNVESKVSDAASGLFSQITDGFEGVVKGASSALSGLASGNLPDVGSLFSKLMGGAANPAGGIESFLKEILGKAGSTTLENGVATDTGGTARNMSTDMQTLLAQVQALLAKGGTAGTAAASGTAAATGAATATPAATSTTASSSAGTSYESIIGDYQNATNSANGLTSTQNKLLSDPNLSPEDKAKLTAQFKMQNATDAAEFCSNMAKLLAKPGETIAQNLRG